MGPQWVACRPAFFLPVRVLSRVFRRLFLTLLRQAYTAGALTLEGQCHPLASARWQQFLAPLRATEWVVYAKPPRGGPGQVLKYLARYTHRVAIANRRLLALEEGRVTFRWKDYAHGNRHRLMTLDAVEFIRRFLLHILPTGFQRLRHYGLLANRVRQAKLRRCRVLLQPPVSATLPVPPDTQAPPAPDQPAAVCPACQRGRMSWVETLYPSPTSSRGGCSRRAGILPNRTARWADHIPLSVGEHVGERTGTGRRMPSVHLGVPSSLLPALGWPRLGVTPLHTPWEHPGRRMLRRFTPSQLLRG